MNSITKILIVIAVLCSAFILTFADVTHTYKVGDPATLSCAVTPATAPGLVFQWSKNGVNIAGATTATYRIAALSASDAGTYVCSVSNAYGSIKSDNGFLVSGVAPLTGTISISTL